jgi:predicted ribosomally synthesized peptide with nif11-like leader
MSQERLEQFLQEISTNKALQEQLKGIVDPEILVKLAEENGYSFTAEDVEAAIAIAEQLGAGEPNNNQLESGTGEIGYWRKILDKLRWGRGRNYEFWRRVGGLY